MEKINEINREHFNKLKTIIMINQDNSKIIMAAIVGAAAGALAGLLLAPESGEKSRKKLRKKPSN